MHFFLQNGTAFEITLLEVRAGMGKKDCAIMIFYYEDDFAAAAP